MNEKPSTTEILITHHEKIGIGEADACKALVEASSN